VIDVITDFSFEDGPRVVDPAIKMAERLRRLKHRCRRAQIPAIYVNDNQGRWREDQLSVIARCLRPGSPGRRMVELLKPEGEDYFIAKPKHLGFFATALERLLVYLQAHTLILTGIGTNLCVFFTASDAHMRDYRLVVPRDCVIAIDQSDHRNALGQMRRFLEADIRDSRRLDLRRIGANRRSRPVDGAGDEQSSKQIVG
jgi:nicotinamidase-related amidase